MFRIEIEAESFDEMEAKLEAALDRIRGNGTSAAPSATAGKDTSGSATPARTASQEKKGSTQSDTSKPSESGSDDDGALDYDTDVRPLVVKLSKTHGREAALDVVSQFETPEGEPATKAQEVQEQDWPALIRKVKARHAKLDKEKAAAEDE